MPIFYYDKELSSNVLQNITEKLTKITDYMFSSDLLIHKSIFMSSAGRSENMKLGEIKMARGIYSKLYATLGNGAEITVIWLQGVVRKAKKVWKVEYLDFQKGISQLLQTRGLSLSGYKKPLRTIWHTTN